MNKVELTLLMGLLWRKGVSRRRGSGQCTDPMGHDRGIGSVLTAASIERRHAAGDLEPPHAQN